MSISVSVSRSGEDVVSSILLRCASYIKSVIRISKDTIIITSGDAKMRVSGEMPVRAAVMKWNIVSCLCFFLMWSSIEPSVASVIEVVWHGIISLICCAWEFIKDFTVIVCHRWFRLLTNWVDWSSWCSRDCPLVFRARVVTM